MQLSRVVPRHTRTVKFQWVKSDFMLFSTFKAARYRMGLKVYSVCYWCRTAFTDDDMLALAGPEKGANRLLCQGCASQLLNSVPAAGEGTAP